MCFYIFIYRCATTPIEKRFPERWEKTKVGMTLEEFKTVWIDAVHKEGTPSTGEIYLVYNWIIKGQVYTSKNDVELFFFKNNKLIRWEKGVS
ncbi:MAG: hypothetical protein Ta2B_01860 [Termitinemataceae bacterium]|nr:MAG: hypothetical protein Ta2B_01860 [Termitinemataceae bacterium]